MKNYRERKLMKRRGLEKEILIQYFYTTISDRRIKDYWTGGQATMLGTFRAFQFYEIDSTTQNGVGVTEKEIKWEVEY